jgi:hypothetical protein
MSLNTQKITKHLAKTVYRWIFKYAGEDFLYRLLYFLNYIWQSDTPPESWQKPLVVPLHKKGDPRKCENYRRISLLISGYRTYVNIIKNKLYEYYKGKLEKNTFQRGLSCADGYFSLK